MQKSPSTNDEKTAIIIVNYNTCEILSSCLQNLTKIAPSPNFEIIVVDNDSTDGSAQMVRKEYPKVRLLLSENKGIAHGYNLGLKHTSAPYIIFMGSDAFPLSETLSGLVEYMDKNNHVGIVSPKLKLRDGTLDMDAHRGFPTPWAAITHFTRLNRLFPKSSFLNGYFLGGSDFTVAHEIDLCISHFMMVRRLVIDKIGGWDEDFFVYGEDVDFCYRVKKEGYKIMYLPEFAVLHYKGVSVGRKESADIKTASNQIIGTKERMRNEQVRAMKLFYNKHYSKKYPKFITVPVLAGIYILGKLRGN
jgi:GT2 family glycosyltransferase